nr:hypothetical protein [Tanacetum cinerariifolium]
YQDTRTWFSGNVTPLFETMMVTAQEEKKIKPKWKQRQAAKVHSPSSEIPIEECIPTHSNDPLPSGEDSIQLNELMIFYTILQQWVLDLEKAKIAQAKEISKLKKRVKKLEKRRKSRPTGLRRLKKAGSSKQVESSKEKDSLGAQEDASKQGRSIKDIDHDAKIALVDKSQGRMHDMFGVDELEGNEVIVDVREKIAEKEVSTVNPVTTASEVVTAASVKDSAAPNTATTADVYNELTLAKTLIAIKAAKPKVARKLEAEMRAEMEKEERIAREKDEVNRVGIEECDDFQAIIDADGQLELIESRRKYFTAKKAEEIRNKPPTMAQQKILMCTYMRNVEGFKECGGKPKENLSRKLKRCLEIVLENDDDVSIEATPLSSKSPTIVDYKIYREEKKSYFKIIRAD